MNWTRLAELYVDGINDPVLMARITRQMKMQDAVETSPCPSGKSRFMRMFDTLLSMLKLRKKSSEDKR